jgi:Acetyltransferase (GNAT) family
MPQTSLWSFLTSSTNFPTELVSIPKGGTGPPAGLQDEHGTQIASAEKKKKHRVPQTPSKGTELEVQTTKSGVSSIPAKLNPGTGTDIASAVQNAEERKQDSDIFMGETIAEPGTSPSPIFETTLVLPRCPSISITTIQPEHLPPLMRLTTTLLPIKYPDVFYTNVISDPVASTFSRLALYTSKENLTFLQNSTSIPIGWIRCSLEPYPSATSPPSPTTPIYNQIYIKALCLLAPYRSMGVATALLDSILEQKEALREHNVQFVFAHVWESNEEALEWYEKRGFSRDEALVEGYYRRLRPQGAWIVRKEIG